MHQLLHNQIKSSIHNLVQEISYPLFTDSSFSKRINSGWNNSLSFGSVCPEYLTFFYPEPNIDTIATCFYRNRNSSIISAEEKSPASLSPLLPLHKTNGIHLSDHVLRSHEGTRRSTKKKKQKHSFVYLRVPSWLSPTDSVRFFVEFIELLHPFFYLPDKAGRFRSSHLVPVYSDLHG
jgi:hypothetical protein